MHVRSIMSFPWKRYPGIFILGSHFRNNYLKHKILLSFNFKVIWIPFFKWMTIRTIWSLRTVMLMSLRGILWRSNPYDTGLLSFGAQLRFVSNHYYRIFAFLKFSKWWVVVDSNHRPLRCQRNALTNWANHPLKIINSKLRLKQCLYAII